MTIDDEGDSTCQHGERHVSSRFRGPSGAMCARPTVIDRVDVPRVETDIPDMTAYGQVSDTAFRPVRFYVVRHGETLFNVMGKVQGWCDTPLTERGVADAEALGRGLSEVDFVAAFSSDSCRAVHTLDHITSSRRVSSGGIVGGASFGCAVDPRLREWCYGDFEGEPGGRLHVALDAGFGEELSFEEHNRRLPEVADIIADADHSGRAERFDAIQGRLSDFFVDTGETVGRGGGGNVLVVTHSFVIRTLIYLLDPSRVNDPIKIPNVSVTEIRYDGTLFIPGAIGSMAWLCQ